MALDRQKFSSAQPWRFDDAANFENHAIKQGLNQSHSSREFGESSNKNGSRQQLRA
jgi:hypothetical protein